MQDQPAGMIRLRAAADESAVVTAGGVTAGIDLGLHLIARFFDDELAATVAR
jgi:transcriptional regulator GlxA family with amidase domain